MSRHARWVCTYDAHAQCVSRRKNGGRFGSKYFSFRGRILRLKYHQGGYNIDALATSSLAVAKILLGEAPPEMPPLVASQIGTETVWQVAMEQSKYWKSVNPKSCEPREGEFPHTIRMSRHL